MEEWDEMSDIYVTNFSAFFTSHYHEISTIVLEQIACLKNVDPSVSLLDFGCGPGEPTLTIAQHYSSSSSSKPSAPHLRIVGTDWAKKFLDIADKKWTHLSSQSNGFVEVRFSQVVVKEEETPEEMAKKFDIAHYFSQPSSSSLNGIVSLLCLQYVRPLPALLSTFRILLRPDGFFINSQWGHPSKVPFLSVLKRVGSYAREGKDKSIEELEQEWSFSLRDVNRVNCLWKEAGFDILEIRTTYLDVNFSNFHHYRDWMSTFFGNITFEIESFVRGIIKEIFGADLTDESPLRFRNEIFVILARPSRN